MKHCRRACQSLENDSIGLGADGKSLRPIDEIKEKLPHPSWDRVFRIKDALSLGLSVHTIHKVTHIDEWFLEQIHELVKAETSLKEQRLDSLSKEDFYRLKQLGYSDAQLAKLLHANEEEVYERRKSLGVRRVYKLVDTCAASLVRKHRITIHPSMKRTRALFLIRKNCRARQRTQPHRTGY